MSAFGVYLHFPWCRKRCPYCDFAVEVGPPPHTEYLVAILRELDARAAQFSGSLVSIYLGGGTPSLWEPGCIAAAIAAIGERFGATAREVTIEANPTDCSDANLNRASGSRAMTKSTNALQRLHTPSKRTMGESIAVSLAR